MLGAGERWRVVHRGRFTGRYSLKPSAEYGPLPKTGDVLAPAAAVDHAVDGLREARRCLTVQGIPPRAALRTIEATLRDLGVED